MKNLTTIAVFYDGTYFYYASNYFCYHHKIKSRISIAGLHDFIIDYVAKEENLNRRDCQISECHYFRGRMDAQKGADNNALYGDRIFDDILMRNDIIPHYLPLVNGIEKGVDVSLALEAFELSMIKKFDIVVLISGDGDYVPLVRKLNSIGTKVMVLAFEYQFRGENGQMCQTRVSQQLLKSCSYPVMFNEMLDGKYENGIDLKTVFQ